MGIYEEFLSCLKICTPAELETMKNKYTVIILGKPGPTGKTTLYKELTNDGFRVLELSETIDDEVLYCHENNHFIIDSYNRAIICVLNKRIKKFQYTGDENE